MKIPYYYRLSFSVFAYNNQNDVKQHHFDKDFKDPNPILARNKAFEEFEEYMGWLKSIGRVVQTKDNYLLVQPDYIIKPIKELKDRYKEAEVKDESGFIQTQTFMEWLQLYEQYHEELRIDIILEKEAMEAVGGDENLLTIHKVASYEYDPDDLLCGGLMIELSLFNHYNFDIQKKRIKVEFYGTDYYQAGDDPTAGKYEILETPRKWISDKPVEETNSREFTHEEIIQKGEGKFIEFKPSLLYNFKTGQGGIGVKFKIAQSIAAFLNSKGGFLYIGVTNNGEIQGLKYDYSLLEGNKRDKLRLEFDQLIRYFFPLFVSTYLKTTITQIQEKDVFVIFIPASKQPVMLRNKIDDIIHKEFYIRQEASSIKILDTEDIIDYVFNHKEYNNRSND